MAGIDLIGMGASGLDSLSAEAQAALAGADALLASPRLFAHLPEDGRPRLYWPQPWRFPQAEILATCRQQRLAILVSGDPSWFSAGRRVYTLRPEVAVRAFPSPSAFSLAASRLGWAIETLQCDSLHGRDWRRRMAARDGRPALFLTEPKTLPQVLSALTEPHWLLCDLGAESERLIEQPDPQIVAPLAVLAVAGQARGARLAVDTLSFERWAKSDGMQTKAALRALAAAALDLHSQERLWDLGAGVGGIASLYDARAEVWAVERDPERCALLRANAPFAQVIEGEIGSALSELPDPHAIFFGGGISEAALRAAWDRLLPQGRLVVHAVTIEAEQQILSFANDQQQASLTRFAYEQLAPLGRLRGWQPARSVVQLTALKP
jgi:precorrin-6Y C5,15-methyltransferase (decarboxylating)